MTRTITPSVPSAAAVSNQAVRVSPLDEGQPGDLVYRRGPVAGSVEVPEVRHIVQVAAGNGGKHDIMVYADREGTQVQAAADLDHTTGALVYAYSQDPNGHARLCDTIKRWRVAHGFDPVTTK